MQMISSGQQSYWSWASHLSLLINETVSKPAIFYRMNKAWVATVKQLVVELIGQQASKKIKPGLFRGLKNVWIQDSTCIQLPDIMIQKFSGSVVNKKQNSIAKLNVIVHALSGFCPVMEWDSFTRPEQAFSRTIMRVAKRGDLVIRDLGYFVLKGFTEMQEHGIYFLSRWKNRVLVYDSITGQQIRLLQKLKGKKVLDIVVLCGKEEKLKVRLIAIKLSPEQAAERRRKAKNNRDTKTNHDSEYYALLDYVIFITNLDKQLWPAHQIAEAYKVRWNIEILFKSWKSGLRISSVIPETQKHVERVESILYLLLLYIAWFQMLVYHPLKRFSAANVSILLLAKWALSNIAQWLTQPISTNTTVKLLYHCCYDKRRRTNAFERLSQFTGP